MFNARTETAERMANRTGTFVRRFMDNRMPRKTVPKPGDLGQSIDAAREVGGAILAGMTKACPAQDCRAANPVQQDAAMMLASAGVMEDWVPGARRCTYCGCVYGALGIIYGWYDSMLGQGWKPKNVPRS
jgi:hypothetical protein